MNTTALYCDMYEYGYGLACEHNNANMMDDMLKRNPLSYVKQYSIACIYNNKNVIEYVSKFLSHNDQFIIACEAGNEAAAFSVFEEHYLTERRMTIQAVIEGLRVAYDNKHYNLISKFDEIYETNEDVMPVVVKRIIKNKIDPTNHKFVSKLVKYLPVMDLWEIIGTCENLNIIDDLISLDRVTKKHCFMSACLHGNINIIKHVHDSCRWYYNEGLKSACETSKYLDVVKLLVDYGADNIIECKEMVIKSNWIDAVKYFESIGF